MVWAHWNLAEIDLIDAHTGAVVAPVHPEHDTADGVHEAGTGALAPLMVTLLEQFAATGLPTRVRAITWCAQCVECA